MAVVTNWYIWYDRMPGDDPDNVLHITGEAHFDSTGFQVILEPGVAGIGTELVFTVVVKAPDLPVFVPDVVQIDERIDTDGTIETVRIIDEGETTIHDVKIVSH